MSAVEIQSPPSALPSAAGPSLEPSEICVPRRLAASAKIRPSHLTKVAYVYVRQSSPHQVLMHVESRERQYALKEQAIALGWPRERVEVIDDDMGLSATRAEHRQGFQKLAAEVAMGHVGVILSLELSRLARGSLAWPQLVDTCCIYGTLLADLDGVYDPRDVNDRLLLGLKGTMSEFELHMMRNRLQGGRLNKARRGELFYGVPIGYVLLPAGGVDLDPDAQVQSVVRLVFEKFTELGSLGRLFHYLLRNQITLPVRLRTGPCQGELEWRRPAACTLSDMLHHPLYAGAYAHGRRVVDPNAPYSAAGRKPRHVVPREEWDIFIPDRWPAYITWDQYLRNQQRLEENRSSPKSPGAPRSGHTLLAGRVLCGACGYRMQVSYARHSTAQYICVRQRHEGREQTCVGLSAAVLDELVSQQVLRALEPAGVELSLRLQQDVERERARLDERWRQDLQRARYEADVAARRYKAVDPENRLVVATLEQSWEAALRQVRRLQDDYDRFQRERPRVLSAAERSEIAATAADVLGLWRSSAMTQADRQAIVRCLIEHVRVDVRADSEYVDATITWAGDYSSQHEFIRPVTGYEQLRDLELLLDRLVELRDAGNTAAEIARQLNAEGFHPPRRAKQFSAGIVHQLLRRRSLTGDDRRAKEQLGHQEWWLADLAVKLNATSGKLADWCRKGWLHARQTSLHKCWIIWANADELKRLRELLKASRLGVTEHPAKLTTPKPRQNRR